MSSAVILASGDVSVTMPSISPSPELSVVVNVPFDTLTTELVAVLVTTSISVEPKPLFNQKVSPSVSWMPLKFSLASGFATL